MPDSEAMKAAQRKLDQAVETFMRESGIGVEGKVMTAWALVAHHHGFGDTGDEESFHGIAYMNGSLPDHVALGLFQIAADTVRGVGRWGRED